MSRWVRCAVWTWVLSLAVAQGADAITVGVVPSSPGLDDGQSCQLTDTTCASPVLTLSADAAVSGSITFANNLLNPVELVDVTFVTTAPAVMSGRVRSSSKGAAGSSGVAIRVAIIAETRVGPKHERHTDERSGPRRPRAPGAGDAGAGDLTSGRRPP